MFFKDMHQLGAIVNWAYYWCGCQIYWDEKTCKLCETNLRSKRLGFYGITLYWWWYLSFLAVRCYYGANTVHKDLEDSLCLLMLMIGLPIGNIMLIFIFKSKELIKAVNSSISSKGSLRL